MPISCHTPPSCGYVSKKDGAQVRLKVAHETPLESNGNFNRNQYRIKAVHS
ncbi:hypothetical protein [Maribacter sp.]